MFDQVFNIFTMARRIRRPLILDGAMGSVLQREHGTNELLWMSYLNMDDPEAVISLHKEYIKAGADIITTNTFRTNPYVVKKSKYDFESLAVKGVENAFIAAGDNSIVIAGCNPPAEDCYQKDRTLSYNELEFNHTNHIKALYHNNVYFILNETQSHKDEIEIICGYCYENKIPFVISLYFDENLQILSGEHLDDIIKFILPYAPLAIGFNCVKPETFMKYFENSNFDFNWGVYLNCGTGNIPDEVFECSISPEEYKEFISVILKKNPSFIGACCGSFPSHISSIKEYLDEKICH